MSTIDVAIPSRPHYLLRFHPLTPMGRSLAFPCGDDGCVDMDSLEDGALRSYLYARAVIGFEFTHPSVEEMGR